MSESTDISLNVICEDQNILAEMSALAQELDDTKGFLKSLWSKSSTDIGLFHLPKPPYETVYFRFPLKRDVDLNPVSEKTIFVNKNLEGAAIEMLRQLEKMGVICRAYTPWDAQTFYIPKVKPEITRVEWVKQGNKEVDYVLGTKDTKASQTVRMVHWFFTLNNLCTNNPIFQLDCWSQIKNISYDIKYISTVHLTSTFQCLAITKEASLLTGFDSGVPNFSKFLRAPIGMIGSKTQPFFFV